MASSESRILEVFEQGFSLASLSEEHRTALARVPLELARDFVRLTYREVKGTPLSHSLLFILCQRCAASDTTLEYLLKEILAVYHWLTEQKRAAKILDILEYISCAHESSDSSSVHTITWYLEQFGFLRSYPSAA